MGASGNPRLNGQSAAVRLPQSPNLNALWANLIIEELARCGVTLFCVAPGSRSAPLAIAAADHPDTDVVVHFDERGSAFVALGWARATGRPACWITTSGTAVANGLPAIVEADSDDVPFIALTADRPPELRDTGANQTIRQPDIFATSSRWTVDLPPPSNDIDPAFVLTTIDQAVHQARSRSGPVHLNAMMREPLAPTPDGRDLPGLPESWLMSGRPFTTYLVTDASAPDLSEMASAVERAERGLIVSGRMKSAQEAAGVARLSQHLGWPLIADICSGIDPRNAPETLCSHDDLVLAEEQFRQAHRSDCVILFGAPGVSKRTAAYLSECRPSTLAVVHPSPRRFDPDHIVTHRIEGDIAAVCQSLESLTKPNRNDGWLSTWRSAAVAVEEVLSRWAVEQNALSEPLTARLVAEAHSTPLVLGSSMPIRDVKAFSSSTGPMRRVFANRGASGIDGTVATAVGIARGLEAPVTVVLGDLALLHDLNSLALLRSDDQPPVTIVVVNNDGGGIFHFLPVASTTDHFETVLGTPHGLTFEHAAAQFGIPYRTANTASELQDAVQMETVIIEVVTTRAANVEIHRELSTACSEVVRQREDATA